MMIIMHFYAVLSGKERFLLFNRPMFILACIAILVGIQLIFTGLLGELLMNIFYRNSETRQKMLSEISETRGIEEE